MPREIGQISLQVTADYFTAEQLPELQGVGGEGLLHQGCIETGGDTCPRLDY